MKTGESRSQKRVNLTVKITLPEWLVRLALAALQKKIFVATVVVLVAFGSIVAYSSAFTIPNTFSSGTVLSSSAMNANFTAVANAINGLGAFSSSYISGTLPLVNGGTGSTTGSITGSTELDLSAGGTNQNVVITPSGTGNTLLNGNVGIGLTPGATVDVNGTVRSNNARQMVSSTTLIHTTQTSWTAMTGMTMTVTTGNQPVMVIFNSGSCYTNTTSAGANIYFEVLMDGTAIGIQSLTTAEYTSYVTSVNWVVTPSAGSHTFSVDWYVDSGYEAYCSWSNATRNLIVWE